MALLIPKTFEIFGRTYKVLHPHKVDKEGSLGECDSHNNIIKLRRNLPKDLKELTYLHEVTHAILDSLEYNKLSKDEVFVERFSKALQQVLNSSK